MFELDQVPSLMDQYSAVTATTPMAFLTNATFEAFVARHANVLVQFCVPWHAPCQAMVVVWKALVQLRLREARKGRPLA